jgi:hypothetical protein
VTLESLSSFTTALHRTAETGLFKSGQLPWAVSIFDLQVIADHCHIPAQFIHYLRRRLQLNKETKLNAHDELDWFGAYLANGLLFGPELADADEVSLGSFTDEFDAWYLFEAEERKRLTKKKEMAIAPFWIEMIHKMEKIAAPGWSEGALFLLDLSDDARKKAEIQARRSIKRVNGGKAKVSGHIATVGAGLWGFSLHFMNDVLDTRIAAVQSDVAVKVRRLFCLSTLSLLANARGNELISISVTVPSSLEPGVSLLVVNGTEDEE